MKTGCRRFIGILICFTIIRTPLLSAENRIDQIRQAIQDHGANWKAGENWVTRLSVEEQRALCGAIIIPDDYSIASLVQFEPVDLPAFFDWRDNNGNWMTPVKNQGNCGDCWNFSAIAQVETWRKIYNTNPDSMIDLSEQFVLSCGSAGSCNGGYMWGALEFVRMVGVPSEACMPYAEVDTVPCASACTSWQNEAVIIPGWGWVTLDEAHVDAIKQAVYRSPVSAGMLGYQDFGYYTEGVYEHVWGDPLGGHGILIVGWEDAEQCWICKNSWGPDWGENGYFRIRWGECQTGEFASCIWSEVCRETDYSVSLSCDSLTLTAGDSAEFEMTIKNPSSATLTCHIVDAGFRTLFHPDSFMAFDDTSFWCGDPDLCGYPGNFLENLDTPFLDLTGTINPKLKFMTQWAIAPPFDGKTYDGADGCNVWASDDGGKNFMVIRPSYPTYTCEYLYGFSSNVMPLWGFDDPVPGWAGFSNGWVPAEFDLNAFQSDSVVIRFSFAADEDSVIQPELTGFFIDEILVTDNGQILYENDGGSLEKMHSTGLGVTEQTDWLHLKHNYISIIPYDSAKVPVTVHTHTLEPGAYHANIFVFVNDTAQPSNPIFFDLLVEPTDHDLAVKSILSPGEFIPILCPVIPQVQIKNIGLNAESGFGLAYMLSVDGTPISSDTVSNLTLESMQSMTVSFDPMTLTAAALYDVGFYPVVLPVDNNLCNNLLKSQIIGSNLLDDFESESYFWTIEGDWQIDAPAGHGSSQCASIDGSTDSDATLTFHFGLDLNPVEQAKIQFWTRYSTDANQQVCYFEISTDCLDWTKIDSVTGKQSTWTLREIDLTPCIQSGQNRVWFRFYYATEGSGDKFGIRIDDIEIYPESTSDVIPNTIATPYTWHLARNYPNPFNPETCIEYSVAQEADVRISVYDLLGRRIRMLVNFRQIPGDYQVVWDGCSDSGYAAASSVYLIRLESREKVLSQKVLLLK